MSGSLDGRVALITGASTGLGKTMALHLARAGAKVAINYAHNEARAAATLAEFQAEDLQAGLFRANVRDEAEIDLLCTQVAAELGPIDILIPNATGPQPQMPIEDYDWDFYQEMLDFFVKSPFFLTRQVLPHMKAQRWGRIVNIGSEVYDRAVPNFSAYAAAKGGQRGWTRSMANELAPWNITVNMISPGWIPVERHADDPQEAKDAYLAGVPLGRWGTPDDIGAAALYLCAPSGGFVTGQTLVVNGGNTTC
ncbi:MAG TPA: SDR family oxidoreductase [Planctomycetota bacterium]